MNFYKITLLCVSCIAIGALSQGQKQTPVSERTKPFNVHSHRIITVDGDTIKIDGTPWRIVGIDTPEVYGKKECYGDEATKAMRNYISVGQLLQITPFMGGEDPYGRRLGFLNIVNQYSDNRIDVGELMVRNGFAKAYPYQTHEREDSYEKAQTYAIRHSKGLWSNCNLTQNQ